MLTKFLKARTHLKHQKINFPNNQITDMDFLKQLNIHAENKGTSTGSSWLHSNGKTIQSYSPVDGKLIASVATGD